MSSEDYTVAQARNNEGYTNAWQEESVICIYIVSESCVFLIHTTLFESCCLCLGQMHNPIL